MSANAGVGAYQQVMTVTADPGARLLLLFDGLVRFLRQGVDALRAGSTGRFTHAVARAQAIVTELAGSLDHAAGGPLAADLSRLYEFLLRHLSAGLMAKDARHLDEALRVIEPLREGFARAAEEAPRERR